MNTTNFRFLSLYRGQEVIKHAESGLWTLSGEIENEDGKHQIVCRKNIGTPEEDCDMFFISEVEVVLKPLSKSLADRFSDSIRFIKFKASEGYSIFQP